MAWRWIREIRFRTRKWDRHAEGRKGLLLEGWLAL